MATKESAKVLLVPELINGDQGADREWVAAIPDRFTAHQGYQYADDAIRFAKKRIRDVAWSYSGTLPPPPWPAHPALVKALDDMGKVRDFFEVVDEKLKGTGKEASFDKTSTTVRTGPTLVKYGETLYREVAQLQDWNARAPTLDDMLKLVPNPKTMIFGLSIKTALAVAAGAYVVSPKFRRLVGKVI